MAGILLRTSLLAARARAPRYSISLKAKERGMLDPIIARSVVSGFLRWKRAVSLLADSRGICPFWPLIYLISPCAAFPSSLHPSSVCSSPANLNHFFLDRPSRTLWRISSSILPPSPLPLLPLPSSRSSHSESSRKKRMRWSSNSATRVTLTPS